MHTCLCIRNATLFFCYSFAVVWLGFMTDLLQKIGQVLRDKQHWLWQFPVCVSAHKKHEEHMLKRSIFAILTKFSSSITLKQLTIAKMLANSCHCDLDNDPLKKQKQNQKSCRFSPLKFHLTQMSIRFSKQTSQSQQQTKISSKLTGNLAR